ncbi:MAG: alpha/beta fold hydrolase [Actinomycetota bacterium]
MDRIRSDGIELDFEIKGSGEPVLLIHGSSIADSFLPLMDVPELAQHYQLVRYHRRGYAGSGRSEQLLSVADHACDAALVLRELYIDRAHVVGHDFGAVVALQMALDSPEAVHTLALAEPALLSVPSWQQAMGGMSPAVDLYLEGDRAGAVRTFLELNGGPDTETMLEARLPGSLDAAIRDADAFFENDMLTLSSWEFPPRTVIDRPALSILGERAAAFFAEGRPLLHRWLPRTQDLDIFNAGHLMQIENPAALGAGLAWFFSRHAMH